MIQWENTWKWLCFTPGTVWARVALTMWQFFLMGVPTVGGLLGGWSWALGGAGAAFMAHEWFFRAYSLYVARIPTMDDGDVVGTAQKSDYTFERFIGPVC